MKTATVLFAVAAITALPAAIASAQQFPLTVVQFAGGPDQLVEFTGPTAVVYAGDDKPLFRGQRAFVLGFTGNEAGRVFAWDLTRKKVRVSPTGRPPIWLACSELKAMTLACSTSLRIANDGTLVVSGVARSGAVRGSGGGDLDPVALSRLPNCPGDPRCP